MIRHYRLSLLVALALLGANTAAAYDCCDEAKFWNDNNPEYCYACCEESYDECYASCESGVGINIWETCDAYCQDAVTDCQINDCSQCEYIEDPNQGPGSGGGGGGGWADLRDHDAALLILARAAGDCEGS